MDAAVHGFANGALPPSPFDNEVRPDAYSDGFVPNGSDPSSHAQISHDNKGDIASRGMDGGVHRFTSGALTHFEEKWDRPETAPAPNGSDPTSHAQISHDNKGDIASRGMDGGVHRFTTGALTHFEEKWDRPETAPAPNGSDPTSHAQIQGDINPRGMDAKVNGFANGALPPSPFDNEVRPDSGFVPNGSDPSSHA
jgi:hypothetical protein